MDQFSAQFFRTDATWSTRPGTQNLSWHPSSFKRGQEATVQNVLVREFPTVSILDVERTGKKILQVVGQMTWALQLMATLSVLAGLVILFCVVREKARSQSWEMNLQKVLGCTGRQLRHQVWIEFGILGEALP